MPALPLVHILYFDAGGGHRSAATALQAAISKQGKPWDAKLVNLQDVLRPMDIFRRYARIEMQEIYNSLLRRGWTLGSGLLLPPMHGLIRLYLPSLAKLLAEFWRRERPEMVVSVVPNFNRVFYEAIQAYEPRVPLVTILTDLADYPPHFWIEEQPQYFVCGTEKAMEQAYALGHPPERVFRVSGMILKPNFYDLPPLDRLAERERRGLAPDVPTGLVMFGGFGSSMMAKIARRLRDFPAPLQLIFLCGRNERLAMRLLAMESRVPFTVVGFTDEVPTYMRLADFFIGKPGPGSISEALAMRLPVVVERNAWTLPQERYNTDWVGKQRVGLVLSSFDDVRGAVEDLLVGGSLDTYRANAAGLDNRAVFEIPDILDRVMASVTSHA